MLTQPAPDKKNDPKPPLIVNKTSEGPVLVADLKWELDIARMTPTWIPGDLWVACYREGQNYFIGVFDFLNQQKIATLDFDKDPPSFVNPDPRRYSPNPRVIPMTKTNHFVIAYQSEQRSILKRWDSKTFKCDKTFELSPYLPYNFIDIANMISINDILFFNRSSRDFLFPDGRFVGSFCGLDPSLLNVKFDDILELGDGNAQLIRPLHPLGKNGLIASKGREEVIVFDTNSRTVCLNFPHGRNQVCVSPNSEHICLYNSSKDYFTLVTLHYPNKDKQPHYYSQTIRLPGDGNTLQDMHWSEEGYLVALIRDASQKNYRLQVINVIPDLTNNPDYPNRIFFEMGQVIDIFTSQPRVVFNDERIGVFLYSSQKPEKVESFQTYSLVNRQRLQNLSLAVSQSTQGFPKGICDMIAGYAYGRMFPLTTGVSEVAALSQLQVGKRA